MSTYRNVDVALRHLAHELTHNAEEVGSRQGERTRELLMQQTTLTSPLEREVLLPGRKASLAAQIAETVWVLAGRNDIDWLEPYLPRVADFSDDGQTWKGGYGPRLRNWQGDLNITGSGFDQLAHVVELLKSERGTRRAVMSIYEPYEDSYGGLDVPCNNWLSFISREGELHLHVAVRSNDLVWGWSGINQFEWSVLLEIVAHLTGNAVGEVTFSTTSLHTYQKHWKRVRDMAEVDMAELGRYVAALHPSPRFALRERTVEGLDQLLADWMELEEQIRVDSPVRGRSSLTALINNFPEPMLRSWLKVIAWHWSRDEAWLDDLKGTRLYEAAWLSPKRKVEAPPTPEPADFVQFAADLHAEKNAVYGDSWRRRGEMLAILANIARKVDRLGVAGAGDTSADTAVDLLVYLVKYGLWLPNPEHPEHADRPTLVHMELQALEEQENGYDFVLSLVVQTLKDRFEDLTQLAHNRAPKDERVNLVRSMQALSYRLAKRLWQMEQHPSAGKSELQREGEGIDAWEAARRIQASAHAARNATRQWNPEAIADQPGKVGAWVTEP